MVLYVESVHWGTSRMSVGHNSATHALWPLGNFQLLLLMAAQMFRTVSATVATQGLMEASVFLQMMMVFFNCAGHVVLDITRTLWSEREYHMAMQVHAKLVTQDSLVITRLALWLQGVHCCRALSSRQTLILLVHHLSLTLICGPAIVAVYMYWQPLPMAPSYTAIRTVSAKSLILDLCQPRQMLGACLQGHVQCLEVLVLMCGGWQ